MIGRKARLFSLLPAVSLEELVPADHFYRHLERGWGCSPLSGGADMMAASSTDGSNCRVVMVVVPAAAR
jgi:hypothetical protein